MTPVWVQGFLALFVGMLLTGVALVLVMAWLRTHAAFCVLLFADRRTLRHAARTVGWLAATMLAGGMCAVLLLNLIRIGKDLWSVW